MTYGDIDEGCLHPDTVTCSECGEKICKLCGEKPMHKHEKDHLKGQLENKIKELEEKLVELSAKEMKH